jgi:hypothetical protein
MRHVFTCATWRSLDLFPKLGEQFAPVDADGVRPAVTAGNMPSGLFLDVFITAHSVLRGRRDLSSIGSVFDSL